jgi:pyrroloquinoline quinone biosynthesis protein B
MARSAAGRFRLLGLVLLVLPSATWPAERGRPPRTGDTSPYVLVLGIAQDGGLPQAGCQRGCCRKAWADPRRARRVASLAIVDPLAQGRWLIDATPDFKDQLRALDALAPVPEVPGLGGIFLTHAHVGHYAGLMHLGREALGARGVPVHAMPRMQAFLSANGPWDLLVRLGNIELSPMREDVPVALSPRVRVTPFIVPHRDEYSETVGFRIEGPGRSVAYVPDIDKWEKWDRRLEDLVAGSDAAYLDGTFYAEGEIPGRSLTEVPHPLIVETMRRLASLPAAERGKVRFTHLNHTNPALQDGSPAARDIREKGFRIAEQGERVPLD